jgi:hypothetical protein
MGEDLMTSRTVVMLQVQRRLVVSAHIIAHGGCSGVVVRSGQHEGAVAYTCLARLFKLFIFKHLLFHGPRSDLR